MATGRDDFVIAFRSAFLKKKDKQKFSLLTLIFLSIFIIILGSFNFKVVQIIKLSLNEFIYKATFFVSIPENKIKKINFQIKEHAKLYTNYQNIKLELEELKKKNYSIIF